MRRIDRIKSFHVNAFQICILLLILLFLRIMSSCQETNRPHTTNQAGSGVAAMSAGLPGMKAISVPTGMMSG